MLRMYLFVTLLCALLPLQGLAQTASPPPLIPAPTGPEEDPYDPKGSSSDEDRYGGYEGEEEPRKGEETPQGEIITRDRGSSENGKSKAPRLLLEFPAGMTLGLVGVIPGGVILWQEFCLDCSGSIEPILLSFGLMFAGVSVGSAVGVWAVGNAMRGEGRFGSTLLGATLGTLAGIGAAIALGAAGGGLFIIPLFTFPPVGAMLGYELSHEAERADREADRLTVLPVLSASSSGGLVAGLVGRF